MKKIFNKNYEGYMDHLFLNKVANHYMKIKQRKEVIN